MTLIYLIVRYTESFIQPFMDENGFNGDFKSLIENNETIRVAWY